MKVRLADRSHNASRDRVALHDPAEDIHHDTFHVGIAKDDFKSRGDLFFAGTTADVEKVCGLATIMLDDVHGGHRETCAVDKAGDIAIELDIIEVEFAGLDLQGRFLTKIAHGVNFFVTEEGVVIDADLGIDRRKRILAIGAFDDAERIDLYHAGIAFPPCFINTEEELYRGRN